ncbi:HU family DNA-binding protein [bacterium]|nr:HU family DNA-binding protein [bacterium]
MKKDDLVKSLAKKLNLANRDSKKIVEIIIDTITLSLKKNEGIKIRGLGSFEIKNRASRKGRIIATGEQVTIPPRKVPVFIPGLTLKKRVN